VPDLFSITKYYQFLKLFPITLAGDLCKLVFISVTLPADRHGLFSLDDYITQDLVLQLNLLKEKMNINSFASFN
jgi:hypothetical protein